jgi:GR25 family glycosyltransferase involved in LPS biosynthesis
MDNGTVGCEGSHRKAWTYLAGTQSDWAVVLEDDAQPVEGFREQLEQALTSSPCNVVSLYLGQGRPPHWQARVQQAIHQAELDDACWIVGRRLLHGVAVAIRTDLVPSMLQHITPSTRPIDFAIKDWAVEAGHDIAFTMPSLCNHADTDTLIPDRTDSARTEARKAWRVGTRDRWTSKSVDL